MSCWVMLINLSLMLIFFKDLDLLKLFGNVFG